MQYANQIKIILISLLAFAILTNCSATKHFSERIIEKPIIKEIILPSESLTTYYTIDSLYPYKIISQFTDSLGNNLATVTNDLRAQLTTLNLNQRAVTIIDTLRDTLIIKEKSVVERLIPIANDALTLTDKLILYGGIGLLLALIIWRRTKLL